MPAAADADGRGYRRHAVVGPLGGLVGAFAVVAGLIFVNQVGAGAFAGLTITANILMSLIIDKYGWFGMEVHPRMLGAALMVGGIALISLF
jgi:transporter family-2 protein